MQQIFSISPSTSFSGCSLVAVYNSHAYGNYINILLEDKNITSCLIFTVEGTGAILLKNNERIDLPEKSVFVGNHADIHALTSSGAHWHFLCYWFNPVGINYATNMVFTNRTVVPEEENALATKIINLINSGNSNDVKYANSLFTTKFLSLRLHEAQHASPSLQLFQDVIAYINQNLKTVTSIKELADHFAYSEKHLRSIFKIHAKISPKQYIQKLKLEQICVLLKTSSMSLQEMVEIFNFCSISHLICCFKKEYGITPTTYKTRPTKLVNKSTAQLMEGK